MRGRIRESKALNKEKIETYEERLVSETGTIQKNGSEKGRSGEIKTSFDKKARKKSAQDAPLRPPLNHASARDSAALAEKGTEGEEIRGHAVQ